MTGMDLSETLGGLGQVVHNDPRISTVVLDNFQRINKLENTTEDLRKDMEKLLPLVTSIHEEMVGRKAAWGLVGKFLQYVGWAVAGLAAILGLKETPALHWLSSFPGGH